MSINTTDKLFYWTLLSHFPWPLGGVCQRQHFHSFWNVHLAGLSWFPLISQAAPFGLVMGFFFYPNREKLESPGTCPKSFSLLRLYFSASLFRATDPSSKLMCPPACWPPLVEHLTSYLKLNMSQTGFIVLWTTSTPNCFYANVLHVSLMT